MGDALVLIRCLVLRVTLVLPGTWLLPPPPATSSLMLLQSHLSFLDSFFS